MTCFLGPRVSVVDYRGCFQSGGSSDARPKSQSDPAPAELGAGDAGHVEGDGSSRSSIVRSFHAPAGSDDVDDQTTAERLALERMHDDIQERNFELAQRLKKSVFCLLPLVKGSNSC